MWKNQKTPGFSSKNHLRLIWTNASKYIWITGRVKKAFYAVAPSFLRRADSLQKHPWKSSKPPRQGCVGQFLTSTITEGCTGDSCLRYQEQLSSGSTEFSAGWVAQAQLMVRLLSVVFSIHILLAASIQTDLIKWTNFASSATIASSGLLKFNYWHGLHCVYAQWK